MIKVGIAGAESRTAAELLRLLVHHPDVDIVTLYAPEWAGRAVASVHHGFIGEPRLGFSSHFDATALDVAFLLRPLYSESDWVKLMADRPQLKLVVFPGAEMAAAGGMGSPVYGLSELNRKPLVRGARMAVVPNTIASPVLVALYPLAHHMLLDSQLTLEVEVPAQFATPDSLKAAKKEIEHHLGYLQGSFSGDVKVNVTESPRERAMRIRTSFPCAVGIDEIFKIYDSIYDDHNFTHIVSAPVDTKEIEGTDKIVVAAFKPDAGTLTLDIVADPTMRGGAGEAVHIMNLLFNLHEKTGLDLKSAVF